MCCENRETCDRVHAYCFAARLDLVPPCHVLDDDVYTLDDAIMDFIEGVDEGWDDGEDCGMTN